MKRKIPTKSIGTVSAKVLSTLIERGKSIFSLEDAIEIYGLSRQQTSDFLRDLVNRGILARIKSGVFLILHMGHEDTQLSNWPLIAHALVGDDNYQISYYSAMRLHGMTTHPLVEVFITLPRRLAPKTVHHILYRFIYSKPEHIWGITELWVTKQEKVCVSDIERTLLDGLDRPDLCGGIKEIVRGIWSMQKKIDWQKMITYAKKYKSIAAVKRLGFLLEILELGGDSVQLLEKIISEKKDYALLDPNGLKSGHYMTRWWIRINLNVDELKAGVWG